MVQKKLYSQRVDIYNAADLVCQFFLPNDMDEDAPTVGKFWGAIMSFVKGIFNYIPAEKRHSFRIQDALVHAWMHLLMGLIMSSKDIGNWSEHLDVCSDLFTEGAKDIISQFSTVDLLEHAVMQPLELVSLLSLKLIQDSTDEKTDLTESYFKEVEDLDCEIRENPNRSHQSRISWIKEEISIIQEVVRAQKSMVAQLQLWPLSRDRAHQTGAEAFILKGDTDKSMLERAGRTERDLQQSTQQTSSRLRTVQIITTERRVQGEPRHHHRSIAPQQDGYYGTPYNSTPYHSTPYHSTPYHSTPYHSTPYQFYNNNNDNDFNMGASLTESFKLSPTDPNGLLGLLLGDCQTYLERRDGELSKLNYASSNLLGMNANQIDSTKDRQEAAVYAFTMVTIVFLPLGTISSIFGMNVSDIANLELSQWVFWATALPVTALVIITGLWWMGELRNLVDWLRGRLGGTDRGRDARRRGGRWQRSRTPSPPRVGMRYPMIADYYR
ncbi:Mg2+ transporter protein- CorA-like protein [Apiospora arundinis]